jgi:diaminopimelate decarboxylase
MSLLIGNKHAEQPWFAERNDELVFAGRTLSEIVAQIGSTPFYAYDRSVMTRKVELLRRSFPPTIRLHYAVKANPMQAVVKHLLGLTDGLDVASIGEMKIALAAGANAKKVSIAGPGKTVADLEHAVTADITINVESERELRALAKIGERKQCKPRVAIRINADFELKSSGMKMSGGSKQFGIDAERVPELLSSMRDMSVDFHGFHIYSGSQNLRPDALVEAQSKSVALAIELAQHAPSPVRSLNIGGGFGVPLFPGERQLDIGPIAANLATLAFQVSERLPHAELILELGRYLVAESGIYVCEVIERKNSRGQVFLICNGGMHHHLAASGNFGQVLRKNYPVVIGNKLRGAERETASVVGPLCTPLDVLADRIELARAEIGDWIVIFQSGAYGLTASPIGFLSHPAPREVLL